MPLARLHKRDVGRVKIDRSDPTSIPEMSVPRYALEPTYISHSNISVVTDFCPMSL